MSFSLKIASKESERGATMIEFALVVIIFLSFILFVIDISRIFTARAIMQSAAFRASNTAANMPNFGANLNEVSDNTLERFRFLQARELIAAQAVDSATNFFISRSDTDGSIRLINYTHRDNYPQGEGGPNPFTFDAAILRPGESVRETESGDVLVHPQYSLNFAGGQPRIISKNSLQDHPIVVALAAEVGLFTPFLGSVRVNVDSVSFRVADIPNSRLSMHPGDETGLVSEFPPIPDPNVNYAVPTPPPVGSYNLPSEEDHWGECISQNLIASLSNESVFGVNYNTSSCQNFP